MGSHLGLKGSEGSLGVFLGLQERFLMFAFHRDSGGQIAFRGVSGLLEGFREF